MSQKQNMIERLYDLDNLYKAFRDVTKVSGWKESTQRYEEDFLFRLIDLKQRLINKTYVPTPPTTFLYYERGKLRNIESYTMDDRVVQSCFYNQILLPMVRPKMIYDNSASLKDRGTNHFRKRLEYHLSEYAKEHCNNGFLLKGDFKKYFDNLRHLQFLDMLKTFGADDEVIEFTQLLLKHHRIDVSFLTDSEYEHCMDEVYDSISYSYIDKSKLTGEKYMDKSMGIGSQLAQIAGVAGAYRIDNYVKIVRGVKGYGRYMDDFYALFERKEEAWDVLKGIEDICTKELGIFLNLDKTQIISLKHKFTILKVQYRITDEGKIIKIPCKKSFKVEKRKLHRFNEKMKEGLMTYPEIENSYKSWRGNLVKEFGVTKSMQGVDKLYAELFSKEDIHYE